ncbi:Fur-regulated basic protein B [Halobacillus dabanensis]|uniref:Fur-regulated basic protein B n=1 Tax=Halobacillus dabanensis TaxID=240302 RepID=A0A1I3V6M2_HALDA|nr:FbpB family small basic protein [Halobacillus dabanensis]SFJ90792.1 Fur-regulated basic protein B [Halobacillus dabanensis]
MRNNRRISFEDLVDRNKQQLLNDHEAIEKIERQIDEKHTKRKNSEAYVN